MGYSEELRDDFLSTLNHLIGVTNKLKDNSGHGQIFSFADSHKLAEGLLLKAWTHWEAFLRSLLIVDLATIAKGNLLKEVRQFRVKNAPWRLSELILNHPDHPDKFVEWSYQNVKNRADTHLPPGHRFSAPLPRAMELDQIKRMRNAIAHSSDKAWNSFRDLVKDPPFNLQSNQMKGLTVGRFLMAHNWNANIVLQDALSLLDANARHLVP